MVINYLSHPVGLDDFTTTWLHEFLILAAWCTDFLVQDKPIIDYVCKC